MSVTAKVDIISIINLCFDGLGVEKLAQIQGEHPLVAHDTTDLGLSVAINLDLQNHPFPKMPQDPGHGVVNSNAPLPEFWEEFQRDDDLAKSEDHP
jgi:hypothetical protein